MDIHKLREIKKVLMRLSTTDAQLETAARELTALLSSCSSSGILTQLQEQAFHLSIVKALLGIVGSSSQPSLLAPCTECLALLVHGNDHARVRLGEMRAVPLMLDLLSPRSVGTGGVQKCWHRDWVQVYTQAMIVLRKLTYLNEDNQQQVAVMGGIKLIIALVNNEDLLTNYHTYPPSAKEELESLALNRPLTARVHSATKTEKPAILNHFSAFTHQGSTMASYYPVFSVSLITSDSSLVSDHLLEKGVVWPYQGPTQSDTKLTRVCVTCVEDGGHIWCQFLSEKQKEVSAIINTTLAKLACPAQDMVPLPFLTPGDVYVAYVDDQWIRARLLSVKVAEDSTTATVLAIDYGYSISVETSQLMRLPPGCRGIPPQAIPCQLLGVQPPPASLALLENTAAVLRNLAFEMLMFRKEIINFAGTETLLKMVCYPHRPVVLQALGVLLNLSVSPELREEMGSRGTVNTLIEMCREGSKLSIDVLEQVVSCLYNVVLGCHSNISLLLAKGGQCVLADLLLKHQTADKVSHCLVKLMQLLPTKRSGMSVVTGNPSHWTARQDSAHAMKLRVTGAKIRSNTVCHVLESDNSDCDDVSDKASDCVERKQTVQVSPSKMYTVDKQLMGGVVKDNTHAFIGTESVNDLPTSLLRRTVCAFVNTGHKCTIHIGVERGGVVRGVKVERTERDLLRIAVDKLMTQFTPEIVNYSILFVPVVSRGQRPLEEVFVVEIVLEETACHKIHTVQEKNDNGEAISRCYYRVGSFNEPLSYQELRDVMVGKEAELYKRELATNESNIQRLSVAIRTSSTH